jgi:hypothetical protein
VQEREDMAQVPRIPRAFAGPQTPREWLELTRHLAELGRKSRSRVELAAYEIRGRSPENSESLSIALCEITNLEECAIQAILWLLHSHFEADV